ncbi:MAG TPA: primary-amine oxidase [Acidimicrobiales bacterium]|nr:primary-amine oxidase [Acidimicrobiales bacterium]
MTHPLDMLTGDEIDRAVAILRAEGRVPDGALFPSIVLHEPDKAELASWKPGDPVDRKVRAVIVPGPDLTVHEAVVSVTEGRLVSLEEHNSVRPAVLMTEAINAIFTTKEHPEYQAALARRGITDLDNVQIDPWPAGVFGYGSEENRRIARCISFVRTSPEDNGYARPVEGLIVDFDLGRNEVVEVRDLGVVPLPKEGASFFPEDQPALRAPLKPLVITQPEGPGFTVEGNLIRWGPWQLRVTFEPFEGLVLHQVAYEEGGRVRPVVHRASICEMVVPYGDPSPAHGWKNAFDAGEWGLGRMTQPLTLGCDCLGEIHYFDATLANEQGQPWVIDNAICLHEEDYGILWKHVDLMGGRGEVRRSRRLVVSFISTVGNYEYGFFWYLYLDGGIQLEVKLTGIVSAMAINEGDDPPFANVVAPQVAAPHHQHLFCARLDMDVDGSTNSVYEIEAEPLPPGPDNPWHNGFRQRRTLLEREKGARRETDASRSRAWQVVNPESLNRMGRPVSYKLIPTMSTPVMLAGADSPIGKRAGFARHNLWVTPYSPDERRAAGEFPNQHPGGDGLPLWTEADRSITDTDVVLWYTFGLTHFSRPEDWPVMPVEYCGFLLSPAGFFDRNPALDLPPSAHHCED